LSADQASPLASPTDESRQPDALEAGAPDAFEDDFGQLRRILLGQEQERLAGLSSELGDVQRLLADKDALAAVIAPSLDSALRDKIQQNRDEMIEVLHPIIGQTVLRAVTEAIQDLARTVDARVRTTMTPRAVLRRLQAQASGVSSADLALRDALPFDVTEVFLIHRSTGLLLRHVTTVEQVAPDRDLVSGMLTAIRDFAADAIGRDQHGELGSIEYGNRRILIEAAEDVYLAVVVVGVEPSGFRAAMRDLVVSVESRYRYLLRTYQGDASAFAALDASLTGLSGVAPAAQTSRLTRRQKGALLGAAGLVCVCALMTCLGGWWVVQAVNRPLPTPVVIYVAAPSPTPSPSATATATATATPTATPTATGTPAPSATPTATATASPTPTRQVVVADVRANVRAGPGLAYPVKLVAEPGATFNLIGESPDRVWVQICCLPDGTSGWVAAAFAASGAAAPIASPTP
jgi:hypothetical protein